MAKANGTPVAGDRHPSQRHADPPQRLIEQKVAEYFKRHV
jgi:hypothetical protein